MSRIYDSFMQLADPDLNNREQKQVVSSSGKGPIGLPDSYQLFAEHGEAAWYVTEPSPPAKKKKIIFADPLMGKRFKDAYEFELWHDLTTQHAVYLWDEEHALLRNQPAINNCDDFLAENHRVKGDTEAEIRQSLAMQGLDPDEYIILDTANYYCYLGEAYLRNNFLTESRTLIAGSIYSTLRDRIDFIDPAYQFHPSFRRHLKKCREAFVSKKIKSETQLDKISTAGLGEIVDVRKYNYDDSAPERLHIDAGENGKLKEIINIPDSIKVLILTNIKSLQRLDLSQLPHLTSITIANCEFDMSVIKIIPDNIKKLCLVDVQNEFPEYAMQNLAVLILDNSTACGDAPNLRHLHLSHLPDDYELDLTHYKQLESVTIKHSNLTFLKLPPVVNHIFFKAVTIGKKPIPSLDLSDVEQCVSLCIGDNSDNYTEDFEQIFLPKKVLSIKLYGVVANKIIGLNECGVRNLNLAHSSTCFPSSLPDSLEYFDVSLLNGMVVLDKIDDLALNNVKYFIYPIHLDLSDIVRRQTSERGKIKPTALIQAHTGRRPKVASGVVEARDYSNHPIRVTGYGVDRTGHVNVDPDHYRVHVNNVIEYRHHQLIFKNNTKSLTPINMSAQPYTANSVKTLKMKADSNPSLIAFHIEATLIGNESLPVASECPLTRIDKSTLYCSDNIDWYFSESTQQFFVKLKRNHPDNEVKIAYLHKRNKDYAVKLSEIPDMQLICSNAPLLPDELTDELVAAITRTNKLHFMLDQDMTINEKLSRIIDYCSHFQQVDAIDLHETDDIKMLINNLEHQTGVCIESSLAFVVLTRYLGLHTPYLGNQDHAYVEIPHLVEGEMTFTMADLGGGDVVDLTPDIAREDHFAEVSPWEIEPVKKPEAPKKKIFTHVQDFRSLQQEHALPPLISLTHENPIEVAGALIQESKEPSLYIHSPADFKRFLEAVVIQDGKRSIQKSLLHQMLRQGGLLIINWNTFSPTEVASYKSILEKNGTLMGHAVSPKLKIISLIDSKQQKRCESFTTRTTRYQLNSGYLNKFSKPHQPIKGEPIVIDLFNQPNWRERLLATVSRQGKQYELIEGAILQAIRSKRPLVIQNAPDHAALHALLQRIKSEGRLFFNGEMIKADNFTYTLSKKTNDLTAENVTINVGMQRETQQIYLNANNLSQCYQQIIINNKTHTSNNTKGHLSTHQNFYITEFISKGAWEELISHTKLYPNKQFTFTLLPGAEIEGVATGNPPAQTNKHCRVIFSNDPDYYCLCQQDKPLVIDVTPTTTYQNLIANLIEDRNQAGDIDFTLETGEMLQALIKGRRVILNGSVNPLLYQQLLPLLQKEHAEFQLNGEKIDITGQLTLVMPMSAKKTLTPSEWHVEEYSIDDYRQHFKKHQQAKIDNIKRLFHYARALNHIGLSTLPPVLNYANLKNMLAVLGRPEETITHSSNPLKGWLLYDYPKDGEHYAFLNVLAKSMFAPKEDEGKVRVRKIKKLIKSRGIDSREKFDACAWEILNSCSVSMIRKCLGELELNPISIENGKPILRADLVDELYRYIQIQLLQTALPKEDNKAEIKLKRLIKDNNTHAIFMKGPPGTRKTHTIHLLRNTLPKNHYFKGDDHILAWITSVSNDGSPLVLHLDEANLALPGTWDIFKALFRDGQTIYYQGKEYTLSKQHKVIFTGNDESMPGRHQHAFFQHYAEKIYSAMPSDKWLKAEFFAPVFQQLNFSDRTAALVSKNLLWAFHHIKEFNPYLEISLRNVISLIQRFESLYDDSRDLKAVLYETCCLEFASEIADTKARLDFMEAIQDNLKLRFKDKDDDDRVIELNGFYLPACKKYVLDALQHDLAMCERNAASGHYRRAILLEGGSGLGKSTLCKVLLEEKGYYKDAADSTKRYYEISVDDTKEIAATLIRAYLGGSKVVLDELNLSKTLESLLNDLFEGVMPSDAVYRRMMIEIAGTDSPSPLHGFQVFASQNSGAELGRKPLSPAVRNRTHMIHFDAYSESELVDILHKQNIPDAEATVKQFLSEMHHEPGVINTRNLFTWMKVVTTLKP